MENLFEKTAKDNAPLSDRMRPRTLDEFIGQQHIVNPKSLMSRAIKANRLGSCIFFGPPGCGKTTLANIIANTCGGEFVKLNAVSSGVADAKKVIESGKKLLEMYGKHTYLLLDECHRWSKAQSDCVLEAIEKGYIIFIGSTTENPNMSMTPAIVSRCRLFEFKPLTKNDVKDGLLLALKDSERGFGKMKIDISPAAIEHFANNSSGDMRTALNALEIACLTTPPSKKGIIKIDIQVAEESMQTPAMSIDETMYFDILSAFCKSLRGSDAEAALYYSQRLIDAGCDPLLITRRMIAHASEDVGMADSNALLLACSAHYAVKNLGLPEAALPISHAIVYICEAEKSNSVYKALESARIDARFNHDDKIPNYLKNRENYDNDNTKYKYPHDFGGYVKQQYLPDSLKDRIYYIPSNNGKEKNIVRKKLSDKNK